MLFGPVEQVITDCCSHCFHTISSQHGLCWHFFNKDFYPTFPDLKGIAGTLSCDDSFVEDSQLSPLQILIPFNNNLIV